MTAGILSYATIIVALITISGGILSYTYQRRVDRRNQLIEIRRTAYRTYLAAFMDQILKPTTETQQHLLKCEFDLFVVASDRTIKSVSSFSRYGIDTSFEKNARDTTLYKKLLAECLLAMRQDCFEKSKLLGDEVLALMPME
ncbi:MAG: hypothetical protein EPO23_13775 [Xanthobacteraceae bacterium]|nr:MAG: hypothetical protein EPO23_13775 [Xanthobacteraceae bacterium]